MPTILITPNICRDVCQKGLASKLIRIGLRAPIVDALTDLPIGQSNALWRELHGKASPPGRFPNSVANCLTSAVTATDAAMFVSIYQSIDRRKSDYANAPDFLKAFAVFSHIVNNKAVDSNVLYYAIRDVSSGVVKIVPCPTCKAGFIYCPSKKLTRNCPFCAAIRK